MAECNNQAVENVKSNIASQIVALENEINNMQQTISRLENCKGTEENPHNHSSEIGSLNEQISANQELIRQLTELLIAVTEAEKTMEEADRRLRELVEEYQQGKTKRMTPTSAILSINMECLEEKHKAGMISEEEYNQHFNELSELYISSLQSEIDTLTNNMEGLDACDPEYSGLLSRTTEKRKELISFVEEHNFSYPVSAKEIEAIKITNIINDLTEQYNNSISNEQKSAIWKTMQERRKQLEEIDSKLSNELLQIVTISKELNAEKVTSQVFDRLIPVAIRSTNETAVNACIDYKLNDFPGSSKQHKTDNFLFSNGYYDVSCYFISDGMSESEYNKILLYWLKDVDKKDIDHKNYSELGEVECYTPPSEVKLFFENLFDWKQIVDGNREFLYTVNSNKEKFYGNIEETVDGYQDTFMSVDISSIARKMGITDEPLLKAIYTIQERSATIVGGFNQGIAKAACELVSGAITLPSSIISMEQTRLDTYHEILDEQGVSKPNLFEFFFYNDIADWKFLGNTAASSVKGICNEFDEKIINGTTEDRAEVGGEIFFNAICAAFAAEYLSKKKNSNTSTGDLADDMTKTARKSQQNVIDSVESSPDGTKGLTNLQKGNYGEMKMDDFFESKGYERISMDRVTDLDSPTHHGIDGVYYNPDGHPPYIIGEAKYGSSKLCSTLDGKQMSDNWIDKRLADAVGIDKADEIVYEMTYGSYNVEKQLINISPDGSIVVKILDDCGNIVK